MPDGAFPTLTREVGTLVVSPEDPDEGENPMMPPGGHPVFCSRLHSAKMRLFPVKPAAGVGVDCYRPR